MASLKAFLPKVAVAFRTTPDALYSRQRALVRLGLLPVTEGKGPGSGVPLTADTLGVMIIALLAADTLAETDERVVRLCEATPDKYESDQTQKYFVDAQNFRSAVAAVVFWGQWSKGYYVKELRVSRYHGELVLVEGTGKKRKMLTKTFRVQQSEKAEAYSPIVRTAEIDVGSALEMLSLMNSFHIAAGIDHDGDST
jgi:hypothetical protein